MDRQNGRFQDFPNNNHIYWNERVDPGRGRQIGGAIFDKWATVDYENGPLGYPVSREFGGNRQVRANHFENGGEIYYTPTFGARIVWGEIGETWKASGYENGPYGVPTSDVYDFEGGKRQNFEFGRYITWKPVFAEDIENENVLDASCAGDVTCGADDSYETIGLHNFSTGGNGQRRAPTAEDLETEQLEDAAQDQSVDENPELGAPLAECDTSSGTAQSPDGADACYIVGGADVFEMYAGAAGQTPQSTSPETSTSPPAPSATSPTAGATTSATVPNPGTPPSQSESPTDPLESDPTPTTCTSSTGTPSATTTPPSVSATVPPILEACAAPPSNDESTTTSPTREPMMNFGPMRRAQVPFRFSECEDPDAFDGINQWRGERNYACQNRQLTVLDTRGGDTPVGGVLLRERQDVTLRYNSNIAAHRYSLLTVQSYGTGARASFRGRASCFSLTGVCTTSGQTTLDLTLNGPGTGLNEQRNFNATLNWPSGGKPTAIGSFTLSVGFPKIENPSEYNSYSQIPFQAPAMRCDNDPFMRNTVGCVFPQVRPVLDYSVKSGLTNFNRHNRLAQQSGLPGRPGDRVLQRIYPGLALDQNRARACGQVTGPRDTNSCDEYPYASTNQGARANGPNAGPGRTFTGCSITDEDTGLPLGDPPNVNVPSGYSVCLIPIAENSRAGSFLSWFFTKNRVTANDGFWVEVGA